MQKSKLSDLQMVGSEIRRLAFEAWYGKWGTSAKMGLYFNALKDPQRVLTYRAGHPARASLHQNVDLTLFPVDGGSIYDFTEPGQLRPLFEGTTQDQVADDGSMRAGIGCYVLWLRLMDCEKWMDEPMWDGDCAADGTPSGRTRTATLLKNGFDYFQALDYRKRTYKMDKYLAAIRTKPFILLAGISGTGKSRIVRQLAKATCPVAVPEAMKTVSVDVWKPDIPAMGASWREFLSKWSIERLKTMTLEQYTAVGKKDSFCYDLECKSAVIGSIKGNTSFKFGIYEYNPRNAPKIRGNQKKDERYAWNGKYGATREEAWNAIRAIIVNVATAAAKGDVAAVDVADFTPIVKWKIAFLYQNQSNPCAINCFSPDKVTDLTQDLADNAPMSARHALLLSQKPDDVPLLQHGADCWNRLLVEAREEECDNARSEFRDRRDIWNYLLVPIRPNWHDSTELIGYVSRLGAKPRYVITDFVRFLAKAWLYEDTPFFLCLDEMNLAPVEQYFAEYLSVVESRSRNGENKIESDVLIKWADDEIRKGALEELFGEDASPNVTLLKAKIDADKGLRLPPNLIVMGTVNMDETTFSFSRKVLDRAMSFELNEVDMDAGLQQCNDVEYGSILAASAKASLIKGCEAYAADQALCDKVKSYLIAINERLEGTSFKIAYRTRDEMMIYCIERTKGGLVGLVQALDEATSMKILSRIEGDTDRITEAKLTSFRNLIVSELLKVDGKAGSNAEVVEFLGDAEKVKASACCTKLNQMIKTVHDGAGFVSFWQC